MSDFIDSLHRAMRSAMLSEEHMVDVDTIEFYDLMLADGQDTLERFYEMQSFFKNFLK